MAAWYGGGGGDKDNQTLTDDVQVLYNKAAKLVLDRPMFSSSYDAPENIKLAYTETKKKYTQMHLCI